MTAQKRPPFKISGTAEIKHLNVRKEGPDDEKVLAVDLKLLFTKLDFRICLYFDEALPAFLWRSEAESLSLIARNAYLQPVAYANEIEGATVEIEGHGFRGCDVKKFAILPRDGGVVDLTCSVSLYPTTYEVGDLSKLVQDGARVSIEGPPDLFDGNAGEEAARGRTAAAEVE